MKHEKYMEMALEQADRAAACGEVPVGAILLDDSGNLLAGDHNAPISLKDPTAHAEIRVLRHAAAILGNYRLTGTTLYVTIEPCCMCAGALVHARIARLVFGARDSKAGACGSVYDIVRDARFNHTVEVIPGIMADRCSSIIKEFFSLGRTREQPA